MQTIQNLEIYLNETTLKDIVAAHLHAVSIVNDDEEILEIILGEIVNNMRQVILKRIKTREVELIVHS